MNKLVICLLLITYISCNFEKITRVSSEGYSCSVKRVERQECGGVSIDQESCEEKGCCWRVDFLVPWCFLPLNYKKNENSDSNANPGKSIKDMIDDKFKKLEKEIENGKTEFKKYETDFLNAFSKVNSKFQNFINESNKRIIDFWNNWMNFYFPENKSPYKK